MHAWTMTGLWAALSMMMCGPYENGETSTAHAVPSTSPTPNAQAAVQSFGAAVPAGEAIALRQIAANPEAFRGKSFLTSGKITAVCKSRGCWMTLEAPDGEAFVRIAGHAFAIPKDASGRTARVHATLDEASLAPAAEATSCQHAGAQAGCKAQAAAATGKPLAKLELQASGVELL